MIIFKKPSLIIALISLLSLGQACKKDSSDDSDDPSKDTEIPVDTGKLALSGNQLAAAYPEGLMVTALPQSVDATPGEAGAGTISVAAGLTGRYSLSGNNRLNLQGGEADFKTHPKEALLEQQERLKGEGECFSTGSLMNLSFENKIKDICFGFDYGIIAGTEKGTLDIGRVNPAIESSDKTLSGVLSALMSADGFSASQTSEACMVVKGRENVSDASAKLNAALELFQGMLCQAKKDGLAEELPEIGKSIDLLSVFTAVNDDPMADVTAASMSRLEASSGELVYQTEITLKFAQANQSSGEYKFTLKHAPSAEGNDAYHGVLQIESDRINDQNQETYAVLTSMVYEKSGTTAEDQKLKFEVRNASFNSDRLDPTTFWQEDGRVEFNPGADANGDFGPGQANDYAGGLGYFAFDVNPSNYAGEISFWVNPGGSYGERARGFIFKTSQNETDGTLSGCAWAGAMESSIRSADRGENEFVPTGCYTPQISDGVCGTQSDNTGPNVWKQCFVQNAQGQYDLDADNIDDDQAGYDVLSGPPNDMPNVDLSDIAVFQ
ncbi:MAG: hypothetical protein R3B45_13790 [Bdellovibrionota bacterium]